MWLAVQGQLNQIPRHIRVIFSIMVMVVFCSFSNIVTSGTALYKSPDIPLKNYKSFFFVYSNLLGFIFYIYWDQLTCQLFVQFNVHLLLLSVLLEPVLTLLLNQYVIRDYNGADGSYNDLLDDSIRCFQRMIRQILTSTDFKNSFIWNFTRKSRRS